jgi:hypothetical protein
VPLVQPDGKLYSAQFDFTVPARLAMVVAMKIDQLSPESVTEANNARRLFLMVAELHKLGYEGLRATPYLSPSGCYWRCCVVPASMTHPAHGARLADGVVYDSLPRYSSADGDDYFGWRNMRPKTPLILARRFIVEFPKFAAQGKHPDPDYVGWFTRMLELTAPIGVVSAFGDMCSPDDRMITEFCEVGVIVRLPPVWKDMEKKKAKTSSNFNDTAGLFSTKL